MSLNLLIQSQVGLVQWFRKQAPSLHACMAFSLLPHDGRPTQMKGLFVRSFVLSMFQVLFFCEWSKDPKPSSSRDPFSSSLNARKKGHSRPGVKIVHMYVTFSNFIKSHYLELIGTLNTQRIRSMLTNQPTNQPTTSGN